MMMKAIIGTAAGFVLFMAVLIVSLNWARHPGRRRKGKHIAKRLDKSDDEPDEEAELKKELGTMDRILIILGIFLFFFVLTMIVIFCVKDSVPDTLIMSVFGACAVEGGIMGAIQRRKITLRNKIEKLRGETDAPESEEEP